MLAGCASSHFVGSTLRWVALASALASCTANKAGKHEVATGGPAHAAPNSAPSAAIYVRTDRWPLSEASRAPTAVEVQLSRHFQQVLAGAQFSTQYSCVAREMPRDWSLQAYRHKLRLEQQSARRIGMRAQSATSMPRS